MCEQKVFRMDYPTGYIEVNVGEFFGKSNKRRINKFPKLAKHHSSEAQQKELLLALHFEYIYHREVLQTLEEMEAKCVGLLIDLSTARPDWTSAKNAITKQMTSIESAIVAVRGSRWAV